ncbi:MAG: hypothetical protein H0V07_05295 [Propionibacteriales bacterium]|nr:hypothetical protein [Propionibacteriales bacterium]
MRQIRYAAMAVALAGVLAACSGEQAATDTVADDKQTTSAALTPGCRAVAFHHDDLGPGCWAIKARGLQGSPLAELDLPTGFSGNDAWVWVNADKQDEWGAITLMPAGDVYLDPCTRAGIPPKVGPSVEDFATALAAQNVTTTTKPVPVSLDDHEGVYLEMSVPAGFDVSRCRDEELILWTGPEEPGAAPELVSRYWVLDLDGQPVVLAVNTDADATKESVGRFTGIVEATTFAKG